MANAWAVAGMGCRSWGLNEQGRPIAGPWQGFGRLPGWQRSENILKSKTLVLFQNEVLRMRGSGFQLSTLCGSLVDYFRRKHAYTLKYFSVSRVWTAHLAHGSLNVPSRHWVPSPRPPGQAERDPEAVLWEEFPPLLGPCRPESDSSDSRPAMSSR